jgi:hypothetical protein
MNDIIKFEDWKPEVYRIPIEQYADVVENAMLTGKYGIYISYGEGIHAYHGNQPIDYDLCKELDVRVVELNYAGGTIIGSADDLSIIIVFPETVGLTHEIVIEKFVEIISKYVPNTSYNGNDILVSGEKVSGSMMRGFNTTWIWAAQVTFSDYSEYIEKICQKPAIKKPTYIDNSLLTRDVLEADLVSWLQGDTL